MARELEPVAAVQTQLLREAAELLEGGEPAFPSDVFNPLADEVELRIDERAVLDAWAEQGDDEPDAWKAVRALIGL